LGHVLRNSASLDAKLPGWVARSLTSASPDAKLPGEGLPLPTSAFRDTGSTKTTRAWTFASGTDIAMPFLRKTRARTSDPSGTSVADGKPHQSEPRRKLLGQLRAPSTRALARQLQGRRIPTVGFPPKPPKRALAFPNQGLSAWSDLSEGARAPQLVSRLGLKAQ
jgi:hypothetical protein